MSDKPRLLVIEREAASLGEGSRTLADSFRLERVPTVYQALNLLRDQDFSGVYIDAGQIDGDRWAGLTIHADEILDAIADGVAVVDVEQRIIWLNPEFQSLTDPEIDPIGTKFYRALGAPELLGDGRCPFDDAVATGKPAGIELRIDANRYLRVSVTPVFDANASAAPTHLIALTRDITSETLQRQKIDAIHVAGEELADLTAEELAEMGVEERTDLLKYNIARHMRDLLCFDYVEIRLLDRATGRLTPLLSEGMTTDAANRELFAQETGNGVTGHVAATGKSYLCPDTASDPLYLEGAAGARSSLTVPLLFHATIVGTLNVENSQPNAFDDRDRQFLEIYGRDVAAALNTLELLQAEKQWTANASIEAISREVALPIDEILSDATTVLDRYAGHDDRLIQRLRHLIYRAREIRSLIQKVGSAIAPEQRRSGGRNQTRLAGVEVLVIDADDTIRGSAHQLLGRQGAVVETARDGHEGVALARQSRYSAALVDIRLPDMNGYEAFRKLREVQPGLPIILMTGFGYDPAHSIVKARQEGLQTVLYKPFRVDRLIEAVELALKPPAADAAPPQNGPDQSQAGKNEP